MKMVPGGIIKHRGFGWEGGAPDPNNLDCTVLPWTPKCGWHNPGDWPGDDIEFLPNLEVPRPVFEEVD